jgi:hypothetical protein
MANSADDDLLHFRIRKIQHTVIANTNAKAIAVLEFLAAGRKRIVLQRKYCSEIRV